MVIQDAYRKGNKMSDVIKIDGSSLTIKDYIAVACNKQTLAIDEKTLQRVVNGRKVIDDILQSPKVVYGINTGVGDLAEFKIPGDELEKLQDNLVLSHCAGVGDDLSEEETRGMMLLRINALAKGYSGIRACTLTALVEMLNREIIPLVPSKGSLGASGDLVPLAHMANALCGRGQCLYRGELMSVAKAFEKEKLTPVVLGAKEGIALINGTQFMCSLGALSCFEARNFLHNAEILGAMAMEALMATNAFLDERVQLARPHKGQINTASNLRKIVADSEIIASHKGCKTVQDAYTLRCMPQILGASGDVIRHVEKKITIEMNSVTDNPLVFPEEGDVISQGNFHGQPIALALDYLGMGVSELGNWCERLTFRMLSHHLSGLPPFLVKESGLNSGLMLLQYTSAALVAENKILCHPASVDSIPTSASQEDHVSMGATSALKLREIIKNTGYILANGLICAAQALSFRKGMNPGRGSSAAYDTIREKVPPLDNDRYIKDDIEMMYRMVNSGEIVKSVEMAVGGFE